MLFRINALLNQLIFISFYFLRITGKSRNHVAQRCLLTHIYSQMANTWILLFKGLQFICWLAMVSRGIGPIPQQQQWRRGSSSSLAPKLIFGALENESWYYTNTPIQQRASWLINRTKSEGAPCYTNTPIWGLKAPNFKMAQLHQLKNAK